MLIIMTVILVLAAAIVFALVSRGGGSTNADPSPNEPNWIEKAEKTKSDEENRRRAELQEVHSLLHANEPAIAGFLSALTALVDRSNEARAALPIVVEDDRASVHSFDHSVLSASCTQPGGTSLIGEYEVNHTYFQDFTERKVELFLTKDHFALLHLTIMLYHTAEPYLGSPRRSNKVAEHYLCSMTFSKLSEVNTLNLVSWVAFKSNKIALPANTSHFGEAFNYLGGGGPYSRRTNTKPSCSY